MNICQVARWVWSINWVGGQQRHKFYQLLLANYLYSLRMMIGVWEIIALSERKDAGDEGQEHTTALWIFYRRREENL